MKLLISLSDTTFSTGADDRIEKLQFLARSNCRCSDSSACKGTSPTATNPVAKGCLRLARQAAIRELEQLGVES